jgi:hypothetical protein
MMQRLSALRPVGFAVVALGLLTTAANAACPTFHTLTNGSPADATQVMDNFNSVLQCPRFTDWVGIQTNSPAALLDLTGNALAGQAFDALQFTETSGSANSRNWLVSNGAFAYGDISFLVSPSSGTAPGGTPVLYLQKNGSVGINTSSPASTLQVHSATDQNFAVAGPVPETGALTDGVTLSSYNDAVNANRGMAF